MCFHSTGRLVDENHYSDSAFIVGRWYWNCTAEASGTVNWPFFGTVLLRRSGRTQPIFKVTPIVLLKISSCKDKAK